MSTLAESCILSNPDISGVGVRTAIYAQNLLSFIPAIYALLDKKVTSTELDILERQSMTILITAFAILLSAIVQAPTLGLTNFHATIVLNLSWLNNTNTFIYFLLYRHHVAAQQVGSGTNNHDLERASGGGAGVALTWADLAKQAVLIIGSLHLSLMAAVGIWLWSRPATFGGSPLCSLSASVTIFGGSVSLASQGLRYWSITIYSLLLIPGLNMVVPIGFLMIPYFIYNHLKSGLLRDENHVALITAGLAILAVINIILVVDTEVTIKSNTSLLEQGDTIWTFGQTLALLLLLLPIYDIVETIYGRRPKQLGRRLITALTKGQLIDVVTDLVDQGSDINVKDQTGKTALSLAAFHGNFNIARLLIDHGANVNMEDCCRSTPLHQAVLNKHWNVVRLLIESEANINIKDSNSNTLLHQAVFYKQWNIVGLLIEYKADVNGKDSNSNTPLHQAILYKQWNIVALLIKHGANVEIQDANSNTPLHQAILYKQWNIVALLIEHRANVNIKDANNNIPLHQAILYKQWNIVRLLIEYGANVDAKDSNSNTPLHQAAFYGYLSIVRLLVQYGANVNVQDIHGNTPLHQAVSNRHLKVVRFLTNYYTNDKTNRY